jgi:nucleoside-diphosphate-sugar epimerase
MNFLITGGLGHIGSFFLNKIPIEDNVRVVDDLSSSRWGSLFSLNRKIDFREKNIKDIDSFDLEDIDIVLHLAAITNASKSFTNTEEVERVNIEYTTKFINECRASKVKLFIFPSSTSVYGISTDKVYEDNSSHINPQSPYAESKIAIEDVMSSSLGEGCDTNYLTLRLGTIFGKSPGMRFHTAVNKFCYQAVIGKPLTIWKENYDKHRPYLGLEDCFFAINHLIKKEECWNQVYNLITDNIKTRTIIDIIDNNIQVTKEMVDCPMLNQHTYKVSDEKIKQTGFAPRDSIEEAIEDTLDLFRNIR